jgi:hypothetical protein
MDGGEMRVLAYVGTPLLLSCLSASGTGSGHLLLTLHIPLHHAGNEAQMAAGSVATTFTYPFKLTPGTLPPDLAPKFIVNTVDNGALSSLLGPSDTFFYRP